MIQGPWWLQIIAWGVWFAAMYAIATWLQSSRQSTGSAQPTPTLAYPRSMLVISAMSGVFLLGAAAAVHWGLQTPAWATGIPVALGLASIWLALECVGTRHRLTSFGLHTKTLFGHSAFRWLDVTRLRYSAISRSFHIELRSGRSLALSALLSGLEGFSRAALNHAPDGAIERDARRVLEAAANGDLPSVWI